MLHALEDRGGDRVGGTPPRLCWEESGKHYNVAISHAAKKLVRLIYAMEKSGKPYRLAA
jgi:hypothetical protein